MLEALPYRTTVKNIEVHNPAFRDSAVCPKCHENMAIEPSSKTTEKIVKNYSLTDSGRVFLIRMVGLIILTLNGLIAELCYRHEFVWSVTAWFVQLAIGFALTIGAEMLKNYEPLVKITTSKKQTLSDDYEYKPNITF